MPHVIEPASSGRAKCRGCDQRIAKGELRLGERLPNPYAEGEMTQWYHPACAAFKRPQTLLDALEQATSLPENSEILEGHARHHVAFRRLPRINGAEQAGTGRARCRSCRTLIAKGDWRIPLVFYEEGRFQPSGFVHARCARNYFETVDIVDAARHFSPNLEAEDLIAFQAALRQQPAQEDEADG